MKGRSFRRGLWLLLGLLVACPYLPAAPENPPSERLSEALAVLAPKAEITADSPYVTRVFEALDHAHPEVGPIVEQWHAGARESAMHALLDYYDQRQPPRLGSIMVMADGYQQRANAVLERRFSFQGLEAVQPLASKQQGLDWDWRGPQQDKEWAWLLNRHLFFADLLAAWEASGDVRYIRALDAYLQDWVEQQSYPNRLTFSTSWRALEVARRILESWPEVFFHPEVGAQLMPRTRYYLLASLLDHADALWEHASFWGGNHLITEKNALAYIAYAWPEFRQAQTWADAAIEAAQKELWKQTYPDGAYKELTNHYQRVIVENAQRFLNLAESFPNLPVKPQLRERVEAMWNYFAGVVDPTGHGPLNSASDREYNAGMVTEVAQGFDRPDWLYIASQGQAGQRPTDPPSRWFPWAGHAVMRSDWSKAADWAFFDIGPHGTAHQHLDRLHLSLFLRGQHLLSDGGRYVYREDAWGNYFAGPQRHNLMLPQGYQILPPPLETQHPLSPHAARITEAYDFFSASSYFADGTHLNPQRVEHQRSIFYRRGHYWLIFDWVRATEPVPLNIQWHFAPEVSRETAEATLRLLEVSPTPGRSAVSWHRGETDPPSGWYSPDYNVRIPVWNRQETTWIAQPTLWIWVIAPQDAAYQFTAAVSSRRPWEVRVDIALPDQLHERLEVDLRSPESLIWQPK